VGRNLRLVTCYPTNRKQKSPRAAGLRLGGGRISPRHTDFLWKAHPFRAAFILPDTFPQSREAVAKLTIFVTPAKAGVHNALKRLDFGFRRYDAEGLLQEAQGFRNSCVTATVGATGP
jgi:hypothetical protein